MSTLLTALPGDVRLARVGNSLENPGATGKDRPVVVVEVTEHAVYVVGLTTQPTYKTTGEPRVGVPSWSAVGLRGPGYIWGSRLTRIDPDDLFRRIGPSLIKSIDKTVHLTTAQRHGLAVEAFGSAPFRLSAPRPLPQNQRTDDRNV